MVTRKIIKFGKYIFVIIFILGVAAYIYSYFHGSPGIDISGKTQTVSGLSYIKDSGVVNKDLVIKSLHNVQELVGLEGHAEKSYIYTDSLFHKSGWLKDQIGRRTIQFNLETFFKTGIDLSSIAAEDVKVIGNTLVIQLPKHILVSLDIPYDHIVFKTQTGLFRSNLSDTEKQALYTEIRKLVTSDIMTDSSIKEKTQIGIEDALRSLLEKVPNVNRVMFKGR
jgi:hypothetical protein